ncbi:hypothetical protein [Streptomyces morookaense]|uniref:Uncharacterized protein n=1 Tax=Streptomyces morookaense TaxID=1970 RepID=A0A7Y7B3I5_STRMO|nr:hypothetical protein [Streptomyces morookaense]NVK77921.1 hypothetical protein [Streptomyces morookaense]GHF20902.1 hypothetical protein GCM10010359_22830 [Streptomyces morookaense]
MTAVVHVFERLVGVERAQFALCDAEAPFGGRPWQLPALDGRELAVNGSGLMVASTVAMHDADVRFEVWDGPPPEQPAGPPVGECVLDVPSGAVTAWAVAHGPAGEPVELGGPGAYAVRLYRHGGGPEARARQRAADPPLFTGLERYVVQLWARVRG